MGNLRDKYAIVGVGLSEFGKVWDFSPIGFTLTGIKRALDDAGLTRDDVDGLLVALPAMMGEEHGWASRIAALLEISTTFTATMDLGGATPVGMVQTAAMAIDAGMANVVVCAYGHSENPQGAAFAIPNLEFTMPYGDIGATALQAHIARRHMHDYGTTSEQLAQVAVAFRHNALLNPAAQMHSKGPITVEDHQSSRFVVEPLRLFDCCVQTNGGGAVIVTSAERARDLKKPPALISGMGQSHSAELIEPWPAKTGHRNGVPAGRMCFEMAGMKPGDMDVLQIYDGFTILVITSLEGYGFCPTGEGGPFVEDGKLKVGGSLPCCTAGGLLSEGHLMGMGHVVEGVRQMRGDCGERQVKDARTCFVTGYGGAPHTYPAALAYSTLILSRP
ncbi:MAG TPA: thiolase family protein [bacterium]|nr:thiolase family protein [bacterium]